jgi:hypothetical protein
MGFAGLILLAVIPLEMPIVDTVDELEINHVYDDKAKHVFSQAIFRSFRPNGGTEIRSCWLLREGDTPSNDWLRIYGRDLRRVRAGRVWESWTQYDVELESRKVLPVEQRRKLSPASWMCGEFWRWHSEQN